MLISMFVVFIVGTMSVTYAWFLSRYTREYDFLLESDSEIVLRYDSELEYETGGSISSSENKLIPAKEKASVVLSQGEPSPWDVFDVDVVSPAHSGLMESAAQAVKFSANGAYWTGRPTTTVGDEEVVKLGYFRPLIYAYTNDFLGSEELADSLDSLSSASQTFSSLTSDNLSAVLTAEVNANADPTDRFIARNDLVTRGQIGYFIVFEYLGETILYCNGEYYLNTDDAGEADLVLPAAAESDDDLRYWSALTTESRISYGGNSLQLLDVSGGVTYLLLQPNTTFSFNFYAFVAMTDKKMDNAIIGERITLFASLTVQ